MIYYKEQRYKMKSIIYTASVYYTIVDFSAGVHDVIYTRKNNIDRGGSRGQYYYFQVYITSCTPAENAINVLLYNRPVL